MRSDKQIAHFAKTLANLSLENGVVSLERVTAVLAYLEKNPPRQPIAVLKLYQRYIRVELDRNIANVEYAGDLSAETIAAIGTALSAQLGRPITTTARPNPSLLAGVRVRIGCDVYENSIANQLAALSGAV